MEVAKGPTRFGIFRGTAIFLLRPQATDVHIERRLAMIHEGTVPVLDRARSRRVQAPIEVI
jgi:hypothetical protein